MRWLASKKRKTGAQGFTLIELLLVMGLMGLMAMMTFVNLGQPQNSGSLGAATETLVADLKLQQLRAMVSEPGSAGGFARGVRLEGGRYTLFSGTYGAGNTDNFVIELTGGIALSWTVPLDEVVFGKTSGETGLLSGANTITLTRGLSGSSSVITVNRLGVLSVVTTL